MEVGFGLSNNFYTQRKYRRFLSRFQSKWRIKRITVKTTKFDRKCVWNLPSCPGGKWRFSVTYYFSTYEVESIAITTNKIRKIYKKVQLFFFDCGSIISGVNFKIFVGFFMCTICALFVPIVPPILIICDHPYKSVRSFEFEKKKFDFQQKCLFHFVGFGLYQLCRVSDKHDYTEKNN